MDPPSLAVPWPDTTSLMEHFDFSDTHSGIIGPSSQKKSSFGDISGSKNGISDELSVPEVWPNSTPSDGSSNNRAHIATHKQSIDQTHTGSSNLTTDPPSHHRYNVLLPPNHPAEGNIPQIDNPNLPHPITNQPPSFPGLSPTNQISSDGCGSKSSSGDNNKLQSGNGRNSGEVGSSSSTTMSKTSHQLHYYPAHSSRQSGHPMTGVQSSFGGAVVGGGGPGPGSGSGPVGSSSSSSGLSGMMGGLPVPLAPSQQHSLYPSPNGSGMMPQSLDQMTQQRESDYYHAKVAYAANMSELINRTSMTYAARVTPAITPDWSAIERQTKAHFANNQTINNDNHHNNDHDTKTKSHMLIDDNKRSESELSSGTQSSNGIINNNNNENDQNNNNHQNGISKKIKVEHQTMDSEEEEKQPMMEDELDNDHRTNSGMALSPNHEQRQSERESKQHSFDLASDFVFDECRTFLKEVATAMSSADSFIDAVGMMKGVTDSVCTVLAMVRDKWPESRVSRMKRLFEQRLLVLWSSIVLSAPNDVRKACASFLSHPCFAPYADIYTALEGRLARHLQCEDERALSELRSNEERRAYEVNSYYYASKETDSIEAALAIHSHPPMPGPGLPFGALFGPLPPPLHAHHPGALAMMQPAPYIFAGPPIGGLLGPPAGMVHQPTMVGGPGMPNSDHPSGTMAGGNNSGNGGNAGGTGGAPPTGIDGQTMQMGGVIPYSRILPKQAPPPPRKRTKRTKWQLYKDDGKTRRKAQENPNSRRYCKRMWQDDGVTRGCGMNSHPRGVCECWKMRGFNRADWKNGNILRWLEKTYGRPFER